MKLIHALFAVVLTALSATSAHAALTPNGSFSGSQFGVTTAVFSGPWKIGTGTTSVTVTSSHLISATADPYLGNINNLSTVNGGTVADFDPFTLSSNVFSVTTGVANLTLTVDSYTFLFTSQTVTSKVNGNINILFLGNLTGDTDPTNPLSTPAAASFSVSFTQSAPTGSIGASYSLDTPPSTFLVPEPSVISLLGLGMVGFAAVRRHKAI